MYPVVEINNELLPDSSVAVITDKGKLPDWLVLTKTENEYVKRCLTDGQEVIAINSYFKLTIVISPGSFKDIDRKYEELRRKASSVVKILQEHKQKDIFIASTGNDEKEVLAFTEGLILGSYRFTKYCGKPSKSSGDTYPTDIFLRGEFSESDVRSLDNTCKSVFLARDLVNEPNNMLNAVDFAALLGEKAEANGLRTEVYGKKKIEALRMGGIMAVSRGSIDPPAFIILEWKPGKALNKKPFILVGKGVMFDTGGINLKPTNYIEDMKSDMAGAAVVASTMMAIAEDRMDVHVLALIPACDNRPGLDAFVPGDIITMYNGKTVEVINTDAEGRLLLADALSFADNYDPSLVISVATLTGSAESAFGNQAIAAMGNAGDKHFNMLDEAGKRVYERIAVMPFFEEYAEYIKSDIAELKNLGNKKAGAITAGKFLEHFTKKPYMHLDIAGCSMADKDEYYRSKGASGTGVRLLTEFFRSMEAILRKQ